MAVGINQHMVTSPSVEDVIARYVPRGVDLYHWLAIRTFVQDAVRESRPPSSDETRRRLTIVSALTDWVAYEACFPIQRDSVFDLDTMAEFIEVGNAWTPKVKKMARGRLKSMALTLNPGLAPVPAETAYTSAWRPHPYSEAEVMGLPRLRLTRSGRGGQAA